MTLRSWQAAHRPETIGFEWRRHGDWGIPHFYFWTDWWSARLTFCCQSWGFTFAYFAPAMTHHALETGFSIWGRQAKQQNEEPSDIESHFWRVGMHDIRERGYV